MKKNKMTLIECTSKGLVSDHALVERLNTKAMSLKFIVILESSSAIIDKFEVTPIISFLVQPHHLFEILHGNLEAQVTMVFMVLMVSVMLMVFTVM